MGSKLLFTWLSLVVSMVMSFFPRGVLDEILNLIESVSEDFPSYSTLKIKILLLGSKILFIKRLLLRRVSKMKMTELLPMKLYPFNLSNSSCLLG